jgi:type II secretion system protein E
MRAKNSILIGQILIDEGLITSEQLEKGLIEQKKTGDFICATLIKLGLLDEEKALATLARQLNIPYVRLRDKIIDPAIIKNVPAKFASHYEIIPLELHNNTLIIAMADPLDTRILDDIRLLLGLEVKGVLASGAEIKEAIRKHYGLGADTIEQMVSEKSSLPQLNLEAQRTEDLEVLVEDASIIKFVNQLIQESIKEMATDIHLEPFQNELRTRFRIDGLLYNIHTPESIKYFHPAIVSRIKIMAHMNIAERRLPQDGRIRIKLEENELDLRVSTIPTAFGEAVHIRILSPQFFLELEKLGLLAEDFSLIEKLIEKPHGIIFVTGPTGSGKSTTLYACLAKINKTQVKIITIEDPIEYQLRGVNQIQINPKIGLNFATGLRHMLRHDPDVMMVGEVRDFETAEIAIRAALTGHLVFSTLHTNNAAGAVTRLLDMNIEPFLVSSSVECLIAQRLVRLICPKCKTPVNNPKEIIERMKKDLDFEASNLTLYEGKGCQDCRFTGYHGRTGIYEIISVTEPIRELILKRGSSQQIKQQAILEGMRTLRQDGIRKVILGLTTFAEVMRLTQQEELS